MKVFVYTKSEVYSSGLWEFTFHGLELEERVEQFMIEESHLTCKQRSGNKTCYIPFHEIAEIEVEYERK